MAPIVAAPAQSSLLEACAAMPAKWTSRKRAPPPLNRVHGAWKGVLGLCLEVHASTDPVRCAPFSTTSLQSSHKRPRFLGCGEKPPRPSFNFPKLPYWKARPVYIQPASKTVVRGTDVLQRSSTLLAVLGGPLEEKSLMMIRVGAVPCLPF